MACVLQTAQGNCVSCCFIPSWCAPCEGLEGWYLTLTLILARETVITKQQSAPRDCCSRQWSISHQWTALGCCSHPCKNTCGSAYLGALRVAWGWVQGVPRAFSQRVCESAQGEGPLEVTEEHPAELPGSSGMVGAVDVASEGSLLLIPTPD